MSRVSFGSRAGQADYQSTYGVYVRKGAPRGPCTTLAALTQALQEDVAASLASSVPECTTAELTLDLGARVPLHRPHIGPYSEGGDNDLPQEYKVDWMEGEDGHTHPSASVGAILAIQDLRARQIVQRAASRGIVAGIEAMDGYKYSFNNAWAAKDEDGQRFSYICQDSMQNKDRHANGFSRTQKHLKGEAGGSEVEHAARKPTFDCKGSVSIKCSMSRKTVDVYYRHLAIHPSVAERKAAARQARGQAPKRQSQRASTGGEKEGGGPLGQSEAEGMACDAPGVYEGAAAPQSLRGASGKRAKRKREYDVPPPPPLARPLSLVDLLMQSEGASSPPPVQTPPRRPASKHPPTLTYDLPSWQAPPPPPPAATPASIPATKPTKSSKAPAESASKASSKTASKTVSKPASNSASKAVPRAPFRPFQSSYPDPYQPQQPQQQHQQHQQQIPPPSVALPQPSTQQAQIHNASQPPQQDQNRIPIPPTTSTADTAATHVQTGPNPLSKFGAAYGRQQFPGRSATPGGGTSGGGAASGGGGGMFSTLKPTSAGHPPMNLDGFAPFYSPRSRASCLNCRWGKKKCDDQRPICTPCQRLGKHDCVFEQPQKLNNGQFVPMPPPTPQQQPQVPPMDGASGWSDGGMATGGWMVPSPVPPHGGHGNGRGSPDPWFPSRR